MTNTQAEHEERPKDSEPRRPYEPPSISREEALENVVMSCCVVADCDLDENGNAGSA